MHDNQHASGWMPALAQPVILLRIAMQKFHIQGHVFFITTVVHGRLRLFTQPSFVIPLYDSLIYYRAKLNIKLLGYVFMPDHIHLALWPAESNSMTDFMRDFKEFTAKRIVRQAEVENCTSWLAAFRQAGEETGRAIHKVWQDDFFERNIYTEDFLRQKLKYMHDNPVRAGIVPASVNYAYSSARNCECDDNTRINVDRDWN
jgi:REP element-mobilizing transposase RayT